MKQDMMFVHKKEALRVFTNRAYCIIKPKMRALIICMVKKKEERQSMILCERWTSEILFTMYVKEFVNDFLIINALLSIRLIIPSF